MTSIRQHARLAIVLVALAIPTPLGAPATASATVGSYQVSACNYAPEGANNSWAWSSTDTSQPQHYAEHTNCPDRLGGTGGPSDQEGGLSTTDALELHNGAPSGTSAGWTFTAPPDTTITGITYERYIGHAIDPFNDWSPALRADGTIIPGETCLDTVQNDDTCFIGGPPGHGGEPSTITSLSAHELTVGIDCDAPAGQECITGATLHKVWAAMYGATVTLADPTPPTLTQPTGTLWEPGTANGYHHGNETVTTTAHDIGGGVQSITLAADGTPIETYNAACDFTHNQPCPTSTGPQTLTLPTSQLPDGPHTLTLYATDAANNQSTIATEQINTDNNPPTPPTELTATPTQPGSSTYIATWNDPSQGTPIIQATYQLCPTYGTGSCTIPTTAPPTGPATITTPSPGTWTLTVWLTDAAGLTNPNNAAQTTLAVLPNKPESNGPSNQISGNGTGNNGTGGPHISPPPTKPTIKITEAVYRRKLVVHITGPATGRVRVSYTCRAHGKLIAAGTKTVTLQHGRITATFKLPVQASTDTTIRVSARFNNEPAANSTLRASPQSSASS